MPSGISWAVEECGDCPFHHEGSEYPSSWCAAVSRRCYPMGHWSPGRPRPNWCPLPLTVLTRKADS